MKTSRRGKGLCTNVTRNWLDKHGCPIIKAKVERELSELAKHNKSE